MLYPSRMMRAIAIGMNRRFFISEIDVNKFRGLAAEQQDQANRHAPPKSKKPRRCQKLSARRRFFRAGAEIVEEIFNPRKNGRDFRDVELRRVRRRPWFDSYFGLFQVVHKRLAAKQAPQEKGGGREVHAEKGPPEVCRHKSERPGSESSDDSRRRSAGRAGFPPGAVNRQQHAMPEPPDREIQSCAMPQSA